MSAVRESMNPMSRIIPISQPVDRNIDYRREMRPKTVANIFAGIFFGMAALINNWNLLLIGFFYLFSAIIIGCIPEQKIERFLEVQDVS